MIRIAALFVCTVLGAGFATGQEIMRYFADYGTVGIFGVVVSSGLFGLCLYKTQYYNDFNEILNSLPVGADIIIFLSFIVFYSAMISAMGEIALEIFGIKRLFASAVTTVLVCVLTFMGAEKIISLAEIICLPMIIITVAVGIRLMVMPVEFSPAESNLKGLFSPFVYVSYNLAASLAVVTGHSYKKGVALLSAVLIGITAMAIALPMFKYYGYVKNCPLPVLSLLPQGAILTYLYLCTIGGAIFTTAISNSYSASEYLVDKIKGGRAFVCVFVSLSSGLLSLAGFENIVAKGYFVFGVTGFVLMFKVLTRTNKNK